MLCIESCRYGDPESGEASSQEQSVEFMSGWHKEPETASFLKGGGSRIPLFKGPCCIMHMHVFCGRANTT